MATVERLGLDLDLARSRVHVAYRQVKAAEREGKNGADVWPLYVALRAARDNVVQRSAAFYGFRKFPPLVRAPLSRAPVLNLDPRRQSRRAPASNLDTIGG
jgi:hypothetical protein